MFTVILCGGKGVRIRDVSGTLPKPMIRIGTYPILHHIMRVIMTPTPNVNSMRMAC